MSYRDKTPAVISNLTRKLKPGKTFSDFQEAHTPSGNIEKTEFGCNVEYFNVPTRVINAVSAEDPSIIYSIGLSYGDIASIFSEAVAKSKEDGKSGNRSDKLDEICEDLAEPVIAFVAADNNYGGKDPKYEQVPLGKVTPEVVQAIKKMKSQSAFRDCSL